MFEQNCRAKMTQPFLIQRILDAAEIDARMTKSRSTPAISLLLAKDEDCPARKHSWNYRTLTGMLGYLQFTTRPDISMATHQCARYNNCPKTFSWTCCEKDLQISSYFQEWGYHLQTRCLKGLGVPCWCGFCRWLGHWWQYSAWDCPVQDWLHHFLCWLSYSLV